MNSDDKDDHPELSTQWGDEDFSSDEPFQDEAGLDVESEETWHDDNNQEESYVEPWPLGLIAVAIIALLLLAAGGYGVIQQRSAMQEEIRQLQAALATTSSNTEVAASRQARRALQLKNGALQLQVDSLQLENRGLTESLANLKTETESETAARTEVVVESVASRPDPEPGSPVEKKVAPIKTSMVESTPTSPTWFVNFGSYTREAVADSWASRIESAQGKVAVVSGNKGGTHYFRVRIINLPSREIAEKIARQLEQTHRLPRLWIGKQ